MVVVNINSDLSYIKELSEDIEIIDIKKNYSGKITNYIYKEKPEKLVVFNYDLAIKLIFIRKFTGLNFKLIARNINTISIEKRFEESLKNKFIKHPLVKIFFRYVDYVICQSKGMAEDLIKNYKFDEKKIVVINNPISSRFLNNYKNNALKKDSNQILFVGRLEKQKGIDILIEAFKVVSNKNKDVKLKIVGNGKLKNNILDKITELELSNKIELVSFTDNVAKMYEEAQVTVLSSLYEGFPNVLLESISCGTPVVSFDCPSGPSEIIIDGINGYLVEYLNKQDLSDSLLKAINTKWDRSKIGETSERFSPHIIIEQYYEFITSL